MSKEEIKETSTGELEQGEFKIKKKPKNLGKKNVKTSKLDLSKKEEEPKVEIKTDAIPERS